MTENANPVDQNEIRSEGAQETTAVESTANDDTQAQAATDAAAENASAETGSDATAGDAGSEASAPQEAAAESAPAASESSASSEASTEEAPATETPAETPSASPAGEAGGEGASAEGAGESAQGDAQAAAGTEGEAPAEEAAAQPEPGMSLEEMRQIWNELEAKKNSREIVDATVTGANRGGVVTEYNGVEIFVPLSHWSIDRSSEVPDVQNGEPVTLHILEMTHFDTDARRVTGTRRTILRKDLIESLQVGQRLTGRVSSITEFGAFVDIGGVDGLLHVSEMSYARNKQPNALVRKGEELEVIIKNIEKGGKRISLGHKELINSPWVGAAEKYPPDSVQKGKVVSLTDLGAFVELEPGVDGLIRPRELSWTQRVGAASDMLNVGQEVEVMVLNVNEEQERMSLSLKRAADNPWPEIVERFGGDTTWEAEVRELSNKGAVVSVEGVEGFLPRGRMGRDARKLTELKPGDKLQVRVVEIDPKRPSVIFGIPMEGGGAGSGGGAGRSGGGDGGGRRGGGRDRDRDRPAEPAQPLNEMKTAATVSNFSLGDMLGDALREKLGIEPEPAPEAPAKEAEGNEGGNEGSGGTVETEKSSPELGNANNPLATSEEERNVTADATPADETVELGDALASARPDEGEQNSDVESTDEAGEAGSSEETTDQV